MATYPAPAKINLFLHVTGRRDDGYHLLQTAFQFIDLEDVVEIEVTDDDSVVRNGGDDFVAVDEDLAIRAARALKQHTGCARGAKIRVTKNIPVGAGLGGGSSDAATVLVALNELWGTGLDETALAGIGLELGADVPVFVGRHAAFAEGIGEELIRHSWPERQGLLLVPPVHVSTPVVFADAQLTRNSPQITIRDLEDGPVGNDLAPVASRLFPRVAQAFDVLGELEGFEAPRMTGSGGGVFAFDTLRNQISGTDCSDDRLERIARELDDRLNVEQTDRSRNWIVRPFKTLNRSTLQTQS